MGFGSVAAAWASHQRDAVRQHRCRAVAPGESGQGAGRARAAVPLSRGVSKRNELLRHRGLRGRGGEAVTPPGSPQPSAGAASRAPARGWNGHTSGSPAGSPRWPGRREVAVRGRRWRVGTAAACGRNQHSWGRGREEAARGFSVLLRDNGSEVKCERRAGCKEKVIHAADSWAVGVGSSGISTPKQTLLSNLD